MYAIAYQMSDRVSQEWTKRGMPGQTLTSCGNEVMTYVAEFFHAFSSLGKLFIPL